MNTTLRKKLSDIRTCPMIDVLLQDAYGPKIFKKSVPRDALLLSLPPHAGEYSVILGGENLALTPPGWNLTIYISSPKQVEYFVDCFEGAHGAGSIVKQQLIDCKLPCHLGIDVIESIEYRGSETKVPDNWGYLDEEQNYRAYAESFMLMHSMAPSATIKDALSDALLIDGGISEFARTFDRFEDATQDRTVFICHSSKDKRFVRKLVNELSNRSVNTWYDEEQILVGHDFISQMEKGIRTSNFVIIVLTPNFVHGPWAQQEYRTALAKQVSEKRVVILPVLKTDCDVPSLLLTKTYADFRYDFQRGIRHLLRAIREHSVD